MTEESTSNDRITPSRTKWFLSGFGSAMALLLVGLYLGGHFGQAMSQEPSSTIIEGK